MSLTAAHLDALLESGATPEQIVALVKVDIAERGRALTARREQDAERQRRRRSHGVSRAVTVTSRDTAEKVSLEVSPHTPLPKPLPKTSPLNPPIPDWVPAETWAEFKRMRKAMRNVPFTPEAEKRVIAKLETLRAQGHCPEKLLSKAIERGHRTVFEDETTKAANGPRVQQTPEQRVSQLKADIAFYTRVGRDDDVRECRRELAKLEGQPPPQVLSMARSIGRAA